MKSFEERVEEAMAVVSSVSPQQANEHRQDNPDVLFLDPRDSKDIHATTGSIPGAVNIPLDDLNAKADQDLPRELASLSRPIITACQGGPMGALAAYALKQRGFSNVAFVEGGTQGWLDAGYATAR